MATSSNKTTAVGPGNHPPDTRKTYYDHQRHNNNTTTTTTNENKECQSRMDPPPQHHKQQQGPRSVNVPQQQRPLHHRAVPQSPRGGGGPVSSASSYAQQSTSRTSSSSAYGAVSSSHETNINNNNNKSLPNSVTGGGISRYGRLSSPFHVTNKNNNNNNINTTTRLGKVHTSPIKGYNYSSTREHPQGPATPSDFPLIFAGGDPATDGGSVNTGTSQQELLRKKARTESKKRQKNRFGGKKKKHKEPKIVNMPPSLVLSARSSSSRAGGGGAVVDKNTSKSPTSALRIWNKTSTITGEQQQQPQTRASRISSGWIVNSRASSDEKESLTAESTVTDSNGSTTITTATAMKQQYELPYSSVPPPPAVVHSEDNVAAAADWILQEEKERRDDSCSIDEYSFPLLSTNALGGVPERATAGGAASPRSQGSHSFQSPADGQRPLPDSPGGGGDYSTSSAGGSSSGGTSKNVRFSKKLEHSKIFLQDEHSAATGTQTKNKNNNNNGPQHGGYNHADGSPSSVLDHPGLVDDRLQQQPPVPKSILRDPKYKPLGQPTRTMPHSRDPTYLRFYLDHANAALARTQQDQPPTQGLEELSSSENDAQRVSLSLSLGTTTPRFLDKTGSELSPIRAADYHAVEEELMSPRSRRRAHNLSLSQQFEMQQQQQLQQQQQQQYHPDTNHSTDNESIASSRMAFIEAVAAVVIQTAYRRHLARQFVLYLLDLREHEQQQQQKLRRQEEEQEQQQQQQQQSISMDSNNYDEEEAAAFAMRMYNEAAIIIQTAFRGFWARDCLNVDFYCATAIQRIYRGFVCRVNYHYDRYRIIQVQSVWRKCIARERVAYLLAYAILIQSAVRGFLVRRATENMHWRMSYDFANEAATVIQSAWRMYYCWSRYNRLLYASIIQTMVRGWLARRKVATMLASRYAALRNQPTQRATSSTQRSLRAISGSGKTRGVGSGFSQSHWNSDRTASRTGGVTSPTEKSRVHKVASAVQGRRSMQQPVKVSTKSLEHRAPFQESAAFSRKMTASDKTGVDSNKAATLGGVATKQFQPYDSEQGMAYYDHGLPQQSRDVRNNMDASRRTNPTARRKPAAPSWQRPPTTHGLRTSSLERDNTQAMHRYEDHYTRREGFRDRSGLSNPPNGQIVQNRSWDNYRGNYYPAAASSSRVMETAHRLNQSRPTPESADDLPHDTHERRNLVIDTTGDEFEWAYEVWYRKGLLQWTPASIHRRKNY